MIYQTKLDIELEKKYGNNNFYNNISVISNLETY